MHTQPLYCDPAAFATAARAEWDRDAGLRAEFGHEFSTYLAYRRVVAAGRTTTGGGVAVGIAPTHITRII